MSFDEIGRGNLMSSGTLVQESVCGACVNKSNIAGILSIDNVLRGEVGNCFFEIFSRLCRTEIEGVKLLDGMLSQGRSGKLVRIVNGNLNLPVQNLFDHMFSSCANIDIIGTKYIKDLSNFEIAFYIFFHDLCELFYVDVPAFTPKGLAGQLYLTKEEKKAKEDYYNKIIYDNLRGEYRELFKKLILDGRFSSETQAFFKYIDKGEPIVGIWRYLVLFKDLIDIERFIEVMADFFDYGVVQECAVDGRTLELVSHFQNRDNARAFLNKGLAYFDSVNLLYWDSKDLRRLVDSGEMSTINPS